MRVYESSMTALFAAAVALSAAAPASAQQVNVPAGPAAEISPAGSRGGGSGVHVTRSPTDYYGVVPGRADARIPGARRARRLATRGGGVLVQWPGFQMTGQGSRVFVAMSGAPTAVEPSNANQRVSFLIRNARMTVANNRRVLETGAFETPVTRAYVHQRGRDVELSVELRGDGQPAVTQSPGEGGLHYLFLDFPRWTGPVSTEFRPVARPRPRPTEDDSRAREQIRIAPAGGDGTPDPDDSSARAALRQGTRAGANNTLDEPQRPATPPTVAPGGIDAERPPPIVRAE